MASACRSGRSRPSTQDPIQPRAGRLTSRPASRHGVLIAAWPLRTPGRLRLVGEHRVDRGFGPVPTRRRWTIVTPDTSIVWAIDNGFGGYEPAKNLQATLLRKHLRRQRPGPRVHNGRLHVRPYLAKSYDVSADGLTYTFHLSDAVSAPGTS